MRKWQIKAIPCAGLATSKEWAEVINADPRKHFFKFLAEREIKTLQWCFGDIVTFYIEKR